jgi:hypothetical protein
MGVWLLVVVCVPSTGVWLTLDLSSVAFRVGGAASDRPGAAGAASAQDTFALTDLIETDAIMVEAFTGIELDEERVDTVSSYRLTAPPARKILVRPISVPARSWVRIRPLDRPNGAIFEIRHATRPLELALTVPTETAVEPSDGLGGVLRPSLATQEILVWAAPDADLERCARLAFSIWSGGTAGDQPPPAGGLSLVRSTPLDVLLLTDIDTRAGRPKRLSTLRGGKAVRLELEGEEVLLRPGEFLDVRFASPDAAGWWGVLAGGIARAFGGTPTDQDAECHPNSEPPARLAGTISELSVAPSGVALQARGQVAYLGVGTLDNRRDLTPRWLERIHSWVLLPLFWGAFLTAYGACNAALHYLRSSR